MLTGLIAIGLLFQGLRDRERVRGEQLRAQAELVTLSVIAPTVATVVRSPVLVILNNSTLPIHIERITQVDGGEPWTEIESRGERRLNTTAFAQTNALIRPRDEVRVGTPDGTSLEAGVGGPFAIVEFRDARGMRWKRRTDTFELRLDETKLNIAQSLVQRFASRHERLYTAFATPLERMAVRAARRDPSRIPRTLRFQRALWGYWGPGEEDPWLMPEGAPPLWRFVELLPPPNRE